MENLEEFKKEIQKEELTPLNWKVIKGDDLLKTELPEVEFLVEGLIPKGGITMLVGNPSSGKSWLMLEIAKTVASNKLLFGKFKTKESRVLYIDEETPFLENKRRWSKLNPAPITLVDFMAMQGFRIDNDEQRKALLDFIGWRNYNLIIFDSLRDIHSLNENDSLEAQRLIDCLKELTKKGASVLVSHHQRKERFMDSKDPSQMLRGSSAILAGIDSLLSIENPKSTQLELVISQSKLRQGKPISPFRVNLVEEEGKMRFEFIGEIETEITKLERTKEAVSGLLKEKERYQTEIIQTLIPLYFSERTIIRAIEELKLDKRVKIRTGERRRVYLSLAE
jgi:archaellum biogenesis ATPase FlaH